MRKLDLGIAQNKYNQIAQRIEHIAHLSMAKMLAHADNPSTYPMTGDKNSIEYLLYNHYKKLPKSAQNKFKSGIENLIKMPSTPAQREAKYGDLANVDFKKSAPVAAQIQQMPFPEHLKFTAAENDVVTQKVLNKRVLNKKTPIIPEPVVAAPRIIRLSVESIHCVQTVELKKDEILLNGLFTDALGNTTVIDIIDVGKMKDGDTLPLGVKGQLAEVNLNNAGFFPQTLLGTFALIDKDIFADQDKIVEAFNTCAIMSATLAGIGLTSMGIAIGMAATGGTMPIAAGLMTGALVALIGSFVVLVVGGGITLFLQGESSELINDSFVFDLNPVTLQTGESIVRTLNVDISRSIGKKKGNYTMNVKWERIS
ncbi:MAG: hypothetical protein WBP31_16015 [Chitinophagales bacterium]|jgi:hypothetical protein|nr:hypothetical protein [Bacteroidota bacterium]MBL0281030.1 hypothetical protein [Bacteroidota bacterium]MBP8249073.1 hypothetical protein [Chitinophagales bacterium]